MGSLSDEFKSRADEYALQRAKFEALRDALSNYGNFHYVNFYDLLDPNNQNWNNYTYKLPDSWFSREHGRVEMDSPVGLFISKIRDAENTDDVKKQLDVWNSYKPLDTPSGQKDYVDYFLNGGSRPVQATAGDAQGVQGVQAGTQGTQGVVTVDGAQGAQAGVQAGNAGSAQAGAGVVKGGTQGSNNGSGGTQGTQGTQGVQAGGTGGVLASAGVPRGGTKTIGYDLNPGNVSLAYVMRNAPEQERRAALIDEWNKEHGISYTTGKDGVIYRTDPQHPNGYVDPFKNDLATWTRATRSGSTYASPGIGSGGMYATGEGIKDANGNVLTNPGGDWEYQYALKNPQYGLGMMGKMSDAQKNYLQAVSDNMGYKYNFTGANRFV